MIRTNICIGKYSNIFEYPNICHTLIGYHLRRFKNLTFSHFCIFWPILGKTKLVIQNRHNHHRLIIHYKAALENLNIHYNRAPLGASTWTKFTEFSENFRMGGGSFPI